ncbi:ATP-binding protein [Azospirillum sp. A1-3]|uniref:AAA family ATPase n=1 Tax=Azospirillum sp. A1-3 TaxID=185874 RepID=UPI002076E71D|nr:AAA family ATPase [Azospirillum sp. A1-3]MCM8734624.1 ATP-binding protein [Azospirillum sp. A1-3]
MRFLISLYGLSESGKTFSALRLAAGMEPDPRKRMLLDTEGGQRGRAYVDHIPGGYLYASLSAPFTPERYVEALNEIEAAGINVLVIDSISHSWIAEGGVLDMVENANEKNDMAKWAKPKRRLGKMTRRLLSSDMHIILCSRAKQPLVEEVIDGRKKLIPGPVVPVQEKSLRYDMTVMGHMLGDGRFTVAAPAGKCPGPLREVFAAGEVMTEEMGKRLIAWLGGADLRRPEHRKLEADAAAAAEGGSEAFRAFWSGLSREDRAHLKPKTENFASIAKAADAERERLEQDEKDKGATGPTNQQQADTATAADTAYAEALDAAKQGIAKLNEWWKGPAGAEMALGTATAKKVLIAARWRELEAIANQAEQEAA